MGGRLRGVDLLTRDDVVVNVKITFLWRKIGGQEEGEGRRGGSGQKWVEDEAFKLRLQLSVDRYLGR